MGCVRYAERYFFNPDGQRVEDVMNYIPTADQIDKAHQAIKNTLKGVQFQEIIDTTGKILSRFCYKFKLGRICLLFQYSLIFLTDLILLFNNISLR